MLVTIVLLFLILGSLFFIIRYGFCGIAATFLLCGSITDSAGILYALDSIFPYYKLLIWIFTYLLMGIALILLANNKEDILFYKWYFWPFFISSILINVTGILNSSVDGFARASSSFVMSGIPYFFIWRAGRSKPGRETLLFNILLVHAVVAIIIILGKNTLAPLNGLTYISRIDQDYAIYEFERYIETSISFFTFSKYEVQKTAQFHNSNGLGFFAVILIVIGFSFLKGSIISKRIVNKNVKGVLFLLLGLIFWFNSLTRGPIIAVLFVYIYIQFKTRGFLIVAPFLIVFLLILFVEPAFFNFVYYLIPESNNVSITSRFAGYTEGLQAIYRNPLTGVDPASILYLPHFYPLKVMALHGVIAGLLVSIPIIHCMILSVRNFKADSKIGFKGRSAINLMLLACLLGIYVTNGVVSQVLFGILFAEICYNNNVAKLERNIKKSEYRFSNINK